MVSLSVLVILVILLFRQGNSFWGCVAPWVCHVVGVCFLVFGLKGTWCLVCGRVRIARRVGALLLVVPFGLALGGCVSIGLL